MEKDASEIEAGSVLRNDSAKEKMLKRKREEEEEEEEQSSDLNETIAEIVLPFAKTSTKWNKYDSIDTPQRPHFSSVVQLPFLRLREMSALAFMEVFYIILGEIYGLSPISKAQLDSNKEDLLFLEGEGFNVKAHLSRINHLLLEEQYAPKKETEGAFCIETRWV